MGKMRRFFYINDSPFTIHNSPFTIRYPPALKISLKIFPSDNSSISLNCSSSALVLLFISISERIIEDSKKKQTKGKYPMCHHHPVSKN